MSLNTTPRTWVTGEFVTAAMLNTELRDALAGLQSGWTAYTPNLTATTTAPTLGASGSAAGLYQRMGKTVWARGEIVIAGAGAAFGTGTYAISLPVNAATASPASGQVIVFPGTGSLWMICWAPLSNATTYNIYGPTAAGAVGTSPYGSTIAPGGVAWAANARIRWNLTYEAA